MRFDIAYEFGYLRKLGRDWEHTNKRIADPNGKVPNTYLMKQRDDIEQLIVLQVRHMTQKGYFDKYADKVIKS